MDALFTSTAVVALAEIGDKTQLLAILLATRFRTPLPIILGILVATLANHFLAALVGASVANLLDGEWFRYLIAASFVIMGFWTLIPDQLDDLDDKPTRFGGQLAVITALSLVANLALAYPLISAYGALGAFFTTLIAFFLVEMGDKTQLATIALGARFDQIFMVTAGTTLGMMLANVPAVFLGHELIERFIAAALFMVIGVWLALQTAGWI